MNTVPTEAPNPGPHPDPPDNLASRSLPLRTFQGPGFRLHRVGHAPLYFGRTRLYRFDAPADEYGVLYCGVDPHCAFIEVFANVASMGLLDEATLGGYELARIASHRPLRLVDLTGAGLAILGADERLCSGDYLVARRWALALFQHPERPDGIQYRARHDPSRFAAAIFDCASDALSSVRLGGLTERSNGDLLADMMATYGFGLSRRS